MGDNDIINEARGYVDLDDPADPYSAETLGRISRALLAEHERAERLERALKLIADGGQPRGIDAYHVAVAKAAMGGES